MSRSEFREKIGAAFADDILSGNYSYEEVIEKYKNLYPEYAQKFTKSFCSKVRCGRIMNTNSERPLRSVKNGDPRMKRISKVSQRRSWNRMTPELFEKILAWEANLGHPVKQSEIEMKWNVNRTTYHRWKKSNSTTSK